MQQPGFWNWKIILIGAQMLFVAFGAMVLMPLLTGLDPSVALFTAGLGTLLFQWITRRSVPVFLASSFVFVAPIAHGVAQWACPPPWARCCAPPWSMWCWAGWSNGVARVSCIV